MIQNQSKISFVSEIIDSSTFENISEKCLYCLCKYSPYECGFIHVCDKRKCGWSNINSLFWEISGRLTVNSESPDSETGISFVLSF